MIKAFQSSAQYTRPANTTAYTAGDALSDSASAPTVLTFTSIPFDSILNEVLVTSSVKGGTLPQFKLWLFDTAPTPVNDNAALALTDAENDTVVAVIALGESSQSSAVNNARLEATAQQRIIRAKTTVLYGLIEVTNAYTPASEEVIKVTIKGYSDI
jgi:hypothetical protein